MARRSAASLGEIVTCLLMNWSPCSSDHLRQNANAEKGVPHCPREWRAFPNHSTQSFARSVVWRSRPGLGAGTENLYQTERDQSPLRRAACGAADRLQQGPYPNRCDGTCQRRYLVPRRRVWRWVGMHKDDRPAAFKLLEDRLQGSVSQVHAVGVREENKTLEPEDVDCV